MKNRNVLPQTSNGWKLKEWRESRNIPRSEIINKLDISQATYYRYESGYPPPFDICNRIVSITNGAVRYRDLLPNFNPRYA